MDSFEEELAETVRKYSHLYDSCSADYKDIQKTRNSWREIAESLRTEESICRKRWRALRDRFAKAKRRMHCRTGDPNGNSIVIVPPLFIALQWLDSHVKHREMTASIMSDPQVECLPQDFQQPPHDHPIEQFLEVPPSPTPQVVQVDGGIDDVEKEPEKDKKELLDSLPVITTIFSAADSSPSSLQTMEASLKRKRQTSTQTEKMSVDAIGSLRDEDELFLLSLLPSIKRLSNRKKMEDEGIDDAGKRQDKDKKEQLNPLPVITTILSPADSSPSSLQTIEASLKSKKPSSTQTKPCTDALRDEDELFLLSLLPSFKRLTIKQRMEVRMKFQQVLYAAEFEN